MPGPLSSTLMRDMPRARDRSDSMTTTGAIFSRGARFNGVAQQIAERLTQQHIVSLQATEASADDDVATEVTRFLALLIGDAFADGAQVDVYESQLRRIGEVEEVRDDLLERLGFRANALDVGAIRLWQLIEIEQLAVPLNRRQPVSELVRDAGRQFADAREALLEPQHSLRVAAPP